MLVLQDEALAMMTRILYWVRHDDSGLGREKLAGNTPVSTLAVPMMLLCLIDQLTTMDPALAANYDETEEWCLKEVAKHVQVSYSAQTSRPRKPTFTGPCCKSVYCRGS